jgi:hypothetical protein
LFVLIERKGWDALPRKAHTGQGPPKSIGGRQQPEKEGLKSVNPASAGRRLVPARHGRGRGSVAGQKPARWGEQATKGIGLLALKARMPPDLSTKTFAENGPWEEL